MKHERADYRIRVVDDDEGLLKSIRFGLQVDGWQVATFASAQAFLDEENFSVPGCLILDVQMPGMNGPQLQRLLEENGIALPVIFLTAHASVPLTIEAFRHGACDFLLKPVDPDELEATILKAIWIDEERETSIVKLSPAARLATLTERELQIARLVAQGLPSSVIGERLGRSRRTMERHRANLMKKLGVHTPQEVAALLREAGGTP